MGISPCGLIVDVARSCPVVTVRPYRDSTVTTRIRFYFVPEDRAQVPYVHNFPHPCWNDRHITYGAGVGYVQTDNPAGRNQPPAVQYRGRVCGSQRVWEEGQRYGVDPPLPTLFGHPVCCLPGALLGDDMDGQAAGGGEMAETLSPAAEGMHGQAAGGGAMIETLTLVEVMEGEAAGGGEMTETFEPFVDALEGEAAGGGEMIETLTLVEVMDGEAAGGGELTETLEPADGPVLQCGCNIPRTLDAVLHVNIDDVDVPMTLTYDDDLEVWLGSGSLFGRTVEIEMYCDGSTLMDLKVAMSFDDACQTDQVGTMNPFYGNTCSPFDVRFWTLSVATSCGASGVLGSDAYLTVTE